MQLASIEKIFLKKSHFYLFSALCIMQAARQLETCHRGRVSQLNRTETDAVTEVPNVAHLMGNCQLDSVAFCSVRYLLQSVCCIYFKISRLNFMPELISRDGGSQQVKPRNVHLFPHRMKPKLCSRDLFTQSFCWFGKLRKAKVLFALIRQSWTLRLVLFQFHRRHAWAPVEVARSWFSRWMHGVEVHVPKFHPFWNLYASENLNGDNLTLKGRQQKTHY